MSTSNGKIDLVISQLSETQKIYFDELNHLVENARWLTTLVMAEIAGIAAYQKLIAVKGLSFPFVLVIVLLALTILCFMLAVIYSRHCKRSIGNLIRDNIEAARGIDKDGNIPINTGDPMVSKISEETIHAVSGYPEISRYLEMVGVGLFILSSMTATIILFFKEALS